MKIVAFTLNVGLGAAHVFTKVSSSLLVASHLALAALVWTALVGAAALARIERGPELDDRPRAGAVATEG